MMSTNLHGIYAELRRIANYASGTNCKYWM